MELLKQRIREEGIVLNNRPLAKKLLIAIAMLVYNVLLPSKHLVLPWH